MQFRSKAQRRKGKAAAAAKSQGVKGSDGKKSSAKAKGREVSFAKQESAVIPALVEKMEKYDRDLLKYSMKGGKSEAAAPVVPTAVWHADDMLMTTGGRRKKRAAAAKAKQKKKGGAAKAKPKE